MQQLCTKIDAGVLSYLNLISQSVGIVEKVSIHFFNTVCSECCNSHSIGYFWLKKFIYITHKLYINSEWFFQTFCGNPPEVKNGEALVEAFNTDFPVGTNIGYSCHVGFILNTIGNTYAVCVSGNDTAFWQPAVISCERMQFCFYFCLLIECLVIFLLCICVCVSA
ncbi:UNVERIFIED_CONTAM: hypothetical protein NCL1_05305 [Trichonephila clavipes]